MIIGSPLAATTITRLFGTSALQPRFGSGARSSPMLSKTLATTIKSGQLRLAPIARLLQEAEITRSCFGILRGNFFASSIVDGEVESLAFRPPRDQVLAIAVNDDKKGYVEFWDALNNQQVQQGSKPEHVGGIHRLAFSADGSLLAPAGEDQRAILWNLESRKSLPLKHPANVTSVAFSHNGQLLATGAYDHIVRIWNVSSGELLYRFTHPAIVNDVAFSKDDDFLATACDDYMVRLLPIQLDTLRTIAESRKNAGASR
jgi:WD40 repeat protein